MCDEPFEEKDAVVGVRGAETSILLHADCALRLADITYNCVQNMLTT